MQYFAHSLGASHGRCTGNTSVHLPPGASQEVMEHYHELGLTGAIGSTDVTHVRWDRCPYCLQCSYTEKVGFPTIAYQATVDYTGASGARRRVLPASTTMKLSSGTTLLRRTLASTRSTPSRHSTSGVRTGRLSRTRETTLLWTTDTTRCVDTPVHVCPEAQLPAGTADT